MHGDMPQKERESIMKEFRSGARLETHVILTVLFRNIISTDDFHSAGATS